MLRSLSDQRLLKQKMKSKNSLQLWLQQVVAVVLVFILSGCASIVSTSTYPVTFKSNPPGARLTITDENGNVIHQGSAPTTLTLKADNGFFDMAEYTVVAVGEDGKEVRATLQAKLDGWYLGNIIFGGLIGLLIVDPATGAMFRLEDEITVNVGGFSMDSASPALQIVTVDQLTDEQRANLVPLNS